MILLLLTIGCAPEAGPTDLEDGVAPIQSCPLDGSQIGEPDLECFYDHIRIALRSGDQPVAGSLAWTRTGCETFVLGCPNDGCEIHVAGPGTFEITATVDDVDQTADVTLDEADRTTCADCCDGEYLVEQLTFDF